MSKDKKDIRQWEDLVERYFDALTTEEEEKELRGFLAAPEATGTVFDEARAVMGFLSVGKDVHRQKAKTVPMPVVSRIWKVAAVVGGVMLGISAWKGWNGDRNVCEAYIYGTRYTEVTLVMSQMQHSLDKVGYEAEEDIVEAQLSDMFQIMEEE